MNSMTGYGNAEDQIDEISYTVEIKTVNSRYFKANIKLPDTLAFLETDIEKALRKSLHRGTVNYALHTKSDETADIWSINETALKEVMEKLSLFARSTDLRCDINLTGLLYMPGITQPVVPNEQQVAKSREAILNITQLAIERLKEMRAQEGLALGAELGRYCELIRQRLEQIRGRSGDVLREYQEKLKKRVDELLADVKLELDEETLAKEVAVFAERADIAEEAARLDSHLQQFLKSCQEKDHPGRRLDFITQELLREANTIASKASDAEIAHCVVDIKCYIDRLKEQVQNVE